MVRVGGAHAQQGDAADIQRRRRDPERGQVGRPDRTGDHDARAVHQGTEVTVEHVRRRDVVDHRVWTRSPGRLADGLGEVHARGIERGEAEAGRDRRDPAGEPGDAGAEPGREGRKHRGEGARHTGNEHLAAGRHRRHPQLSQGDGTRRGQRRRLRHLDPVGQDVQAAGRHPGELGVGTPAVNAHHLQLAAFVLPARPAGDALAAGVRVHRGDPLARQRRVHAVADGLHHAGEVTPQHVRQRNLPRERMPARAGGDIAGTRNLYRRDPDQRLPRLRRGGGHILDLQHAGIAERPHDHRSHQCAIISGSIGPHLLAASGPAPQNCGSCGQRSCHGRGSNWPVASS